jgi:hypothetical protein
VFYGAEFIRAYRADRGLHVVPKKTAVRLHRETIETSKEKKVPTV